jgi:hypothetical protein
MEQEGLVPEESDPGSTPQEITDLVDAVNRHARALVLLAREVARPGVLRTTEGFHQLMAALHKKHPKERENSLYASVELSLQRLSPQVRRQIQALGVFRGGANLFVLSQMLGLDINAVAQIAIELEGVGLGTLINYRNIAAGLVRNVEHLVAPLGRPGALAQVVAIRVAVTAQLGAWSNERFEAERAAIERKYESGDLRGALDVAEKLLQRVLDAGEGAYPQAPYDIAMAHSV